MSFREVVLSVVSMVQDNSLKVERLLKYVESLSDGEVMKLQTLMYYGRGDDTESLASLHTELVTRMPDREDAVYNMMEQLPLAEYLFDGLERAEASGEDIERPF